uniref:Uncharacterized protein n=1 Tax=Anguilla anguilla TaxID=7936 RepID=A0A0E9WUL3_ANGAN
MAFGLFCSNKALYLQLRSQWSFLQCANRQKGPLTCHRTFRPDQREPPK